MLNNRLFGADWPQFRGPTRNGIAPDSPPLLDEFPKDGLKKVWESEEMPMEYFPVNSHEQGSVVVANGKAFIYLQNVLKPQFRRISKLSFVSDEGYSADMPPELSKLVEEARVSDARLKLKARKEISAWAAAWANTNLKPEQDKWRKAVLARLSNGSVLSWEVLGKLTENIDRKWDTDKEAQDWMREGGIDETSQKYIWAAGWWNWNGYLGTTGQNNEPIINYTAEDFILCFDATNGKLLWKTAPMEGMPQTQGAHHTPAILGNRCYLFNSAARHYCFDVETGKELWHSESFGPDTPGHTNHHHSRCTSELVSDGVAIALAEITAGVDVETGKTLWSRKDIGFHETHSSAVVWRDGQKNWVIIHLPGTLYCLDPKDGTTRWQWTEKWFKGSTGTPTIVGDYMVLATGSSGYGGSTTDLAAFKLTPEKPEKLWQLPLNDAYAAPLIDHGYVYFVWGGPDMWTKKGKACCIELESGKILWEEMKVFENTQYSSPLLADGKIFAITHSSSGKDGLTVFKATPEKFTLIGQQVVKDIRIWQSSAIADGRVYLRAGRTKIVCYDLRKQ